MIPIAVYVLVAINVAVFSTEVTLPSDALRDAFINRYALIPYDLMGGVQIAAAPPTLMTLVTAQFLHGSLLHIGFNMLFLLVFGPQVEQLTGNARFIAFYLLCGVVGNVAQAVVLSGSHVPAIGASGAIAGVLGAYILRFPTNSLFLRIPAFLVIGCWAVTQFMHGYGTLSSRVLSEQGGGTAYFAHIGGFLAGVFAIGAFARGRFVLPRGHRSYW